MESIILTVRIRKAIDKAKNTYYNNFKIYI